MIRKLVLAASLLIAAPALAQTVQYVSPVTRNHVVLWNTNGVIADGGSSADSPITSMGVTNEGGAGFCVSSQRQTAAGRNQLCFGASTAGPAVISLQNYGTAAAQNLQFVINGTPVTIPTGGAAFALENPPFVANHASCFVSSAGVLQDCGVALGAGTQFGVPYYSTTSQLTSGAAGTNGQVYLGQTGAAPLFTTLSGDVTSISAAGLLTLGKVNGIPFNTTYAAHGVLIGQGTSAFNAVTTPNVGQCLLSQGTGSDPIFSSCASGSGSAGGSNTQVQFNNTTALAGSPNFTWVSPTLTLGVAGTTTGQLALAPAGSGTGTVTIQNPSGTSAYNFNLPTAAGSSGQPMLSGGGGSTAMSFGTLGIGGGGTNCSTASGTCLDNITGFSSTGFVQRTGGGTYAFSLVVPVSGGGTGLANGTSGGILGFTGTGTIASSATLSQFGLVVGGGAGNTPAAITNGTAGQILIAQTSANPTWNTASGDVTINGTGVHTIANSAVTVAKQANAAAWTLEGNFSGSSAAPQFSTIGALTQKASPAASDLILIQDQAAAGAFKFATVSSVSSAGSVSSIAGNTGAFTLGNGLTNSTNNITVDASYFRDYIAGCTLSAAGSTSTFGISICIGTDSTNATIMKLASAYTKTTGAWTVGTGNGALDTGSIATNTWYSVFEIERTDTGVVDILISTSATSPVLPSPYTLFRRLGSMKTDGSSNWLAFTQFGNQFLWAVPQTETNLTTTVTTSSAAYTMVAQPLGVQVEAQFNFLFSAAANGGILFTSAILAAQTPNSPAGNVSAILPNVGSSNTAGSARILLNTAAQLRAIALNSSASLTAVSTGWIDQRGQNN
jgi:hypothetical protein